MRTCPNCWGEVQSDFTCHTWPRTRDDGTEQWMSCMPCDSATRWDCIAHNEERCDYPPDCEEGYHEGCGWHWTSGLNPGNPRSEKNDLNKPEWSDDEK